MLLIEDLQAEISGKMILQHIDLEFPGLPPQLKAEIDRAIEKSDKDVM